MQMIEPPLENKEIAELRNMVMAMATQLEVASKPYVPVSTVPEKRKAGRPKVIKPTD